MAKRISDIEFAELLRLHFAELLRLHYARVLGFVRAMVLDANDAQDVFQETVLALWQSQESFDSEREFGAWAVGIARHKIFDYFKSRRREQAHFSDAMLEILAERQSQRSEDLDYLQARERALKSCLETVQASQRELLRRCYEGNESVAEVALSMNRTPGSVYSSLKHVRVKLLECMRKRLEGEHGRG